jgi:hypothetical protein
LTGCGADTAQILRDDLAAQRGRADAGVSLDRQPDECGEDTKHAALRVGDDARSALKRERAQLDLANSKRKTCFDYNEAVRQGLAS